MHNPHLCIKLMAFLLALSLLAGCLKTELSLSGDDYKLIDSLYTKQKDSLSPILDSTCVQFQDSVMQQWVDSIMTERKQEIDKLIGR